MHYRSVTDECCCITHWQTLREHSPDGSTFLREKMSWLPSWLFYRLIFYISSSNGWMYYD